MLFYVGHSKTTVDGTVEEGNYEDDEKYGKIIAYMAMYKKDIT